MKRILKILIPKYGRVGKLFFETSIITEIGKIGLLADESHLLESSFFGLEGLSTRGQRDQSRFDREAKEIKEYFEGNRKEFNIKFKINCTRFTTKVLFYLRSIPYGSTVSYLEVAKNIDNNNAARAVGNACGKNPLPLLIPCHRVVASKGLGGFGGGLERKKFLLNLESN